MKQKVRNRENAINRSIEGMDRRGFYKPEKYKENRKRDKRKKGDRL